MLCNARVISASPTRLYTKDGDRWLTPRGLRNSPLDTGQLIRSEPKEMPHKVKTMRKTMRVECDEDDHHHRDNDTDASTVHLSRGNVNLHCLLGKFKYFQTKS